MTISSVSAVAVSFRSSSPAKGSSTDVPTTAAPAPADAPALPTDTVELSQPAVDSVTATGTPSRRSDTLLRALDADGDGLVSKEEFTNGAIELLKRASVRFHHQRVGKGEGIEKRDEKWTRRLEDVFPHVDANHDGSVDVTELTSALPKAAQPVVTVAIEQYTRGGGVKTGSPRRTRIARV